MAAARPSTSFPGGRGATSRWSRASSLGELASNLNDGLGVFVDSGQRLGNDNARLVSLDDVDRDGDLDAFVSNLIV